MFAVVAKVLFRRLHNDRDLLRLDVRFKEILRNIPGEATGRRVDRKSLGELVADDLVDDAIRHIVRVFCYDRRIERFARRRVDHADVIEDRFGVFEIRIQNGKKDRGGRGIAEIGRDVRLLQDRARDDMEFDLARIFFGVGEEVLRARPANRTVFVNLHIVRIISGKSVDDAFGALRRRDDLIDEVVPRHDRLARIFFPDGNDRFVFIIEAVVDIDREGSLGRETVFVVSVPVDILLGRNYGDEINLIENVAIEVILGNIPNESASLGVDGETFGEVLSLEGETNTICEVIRIGRLNHRFERFPGHSVDDVDIADYRLGVDIIRVEQFNFEFNRSIIAVIGRILAFAKNRAGADLNDKSLGVRVGTLEEILGGRPGDLTVGVDRNSRRKGVPRKGVFHARDLGTEGSGRVKLKSFARLEGLFVEIVPHREIVDVFDVRFVEDFKGKFLLDAGAVNEIALFVLHELRRLHHKSIVLRLDQRIEIIARNLPRQNARFGIDRDKAVFSDNLIFHLDRRIGGIVRGDLSLIFRSRLRRILNKVGKERLARDIED